VILAIEAELIMNGPAITPSSLFGRTGAAAQGGASFEAQISSLLSASTSDGVSVQEPGDSNASSTQTVAAESLSTGAAKKNGAKDLLKNLPVAAPPALAITFPPAPPPVEVTPALNFSMSNPPPAKPQVSEADPPPPAGSSSVTKLVMSGDVLAAMQRAGATASLPANPVALNAFSLPSALSSFSSVETTPALTSAPRGLPADTAISTGTAGRAQTPIVSAENSHASQTAWQARPEQHSFPSSGVQEAPTPEPGSGNRDTANDAANDTPTFAPAIAANPDTGVTIDAPPALTTTQTDDPALTPSLSPEPSETLLSVPPANTPPVQTALDSPAAESLVNVSRVRVLDRSESKFVVQTSGELDGETTRSSGGASGTASATDAKSDAAGSSAAPKTFGSTARSLPDIDLPTVETLPILESVGNHAPVKTSSNPTTQPTAAFRVVVARTASNVSEEMQTARAAPAAVTEYTPSTSNSQTQLSFPAPVESPAGNEVPALATNPPASNQASSGASAPASKTSSQSATTPLSANKTSESGPAGSATDPARAIQDPAVGSFEPSLPATSLAAPIALSPTAVPVTPTGIVASTTPGLPSKPSSGDPAGDVAAHGMAAANEPAPADLPPVQMAQMVSRAAQSEMRIGLNTSAFGSVEVHTLVHASDVGLVIGSEKGDLHALLAPELPGIASALQQQNLRLQQVSFHQNFAFSGNLGSGGDAPSRYLAPFAKSTPSPFAENVAEEVSEGTTAEMITPGAAGLSILA